MKFIFDIEVIFWGTKFSNQMSKLLKMMSFSVSSSIEQKNERKRKKKGKLVPKIEEWFQEGERRMMKMIRHIWQIGGCRLLNVNYVYENFLVSTGWMGVGTVFVTYFINEKAVSCYYPYGVAALALLHPRDDHPTHPLKPTSMGVSAVHVVLVGVVLCISIQNAI